MEILLFDIARVRRMRAGKPKFERICSTTSEGLSVRVRSKRTLWNVQSMDSGVLPRVEVPRALRRGRMEARFWRT